MCIRDRHILYSYPYYDTDVFTLSCFHGFDREPNQRANTPTTKEREWVVPRNGRKEVLVQPDTSDGTGVDQRHAPSARNDYKPIESF